LTFDPTSGGGIALDTMNVERGQEGAPVGEL